MANARRERVPQEQRQETEQTYRSQSASDYERTYGSPYDDLYDEEPLPELKGHKPQPVRQEPPVISSNATINLTCFLAAVMGLIGLLLYFADRHSIAVRRTAVQSATLFVVNCFATAILWVLALAFGAVPLIGGVLSVIFWILWFAYMAFSLVLRWRLALYAYRGQGYVLPLVGKLVRKFE